jgi:GNAT superfamily N-acetyltransferase
MSAVTPAYTVDTTVNRKNEAAMLPTGKLEMVVTYLEMRRPPAQAVSPPIDGIVIERVQRPSAALYRRLYAGVGARWLWYERRLLDDTGLCAIIQHPQVELYLLSVQGVIAGYAELDGRIEGEVELAYFGLMPEFLGRGLGRYLLAWALERAWRRAPQRVWVHTCNFDHPRAVAVYERAGFVRYGQETKVVDDPRLHR